MRERTNWYKVEAGDIISFRYRSSDGRLELHTILLMGVQIPYTKKNGDINKHVVGIKIESRNRTLINANQFLNELKKIGEIELVKETKTNEAIIRVGMGSTARRVPPSFNKLENYTIILANKPGRFTGGYRTYSWDKCKAMAVYFEPIIIPPASIKKIKEGKI